MSPEGSPPNRRKQEAELLIAPGCECPFQGHTDAPVVNIGASPELNYYGHGTASTELR
jgi:hypothetical protein